MSQKILATWNLIAVCLYIDINQQPTVYTPWPLPGILAGPYEESLTAKHMCQTHIALMLKAQEDHVTHTAPSEPMTNIVQQGMSVLTLARPLLSLKPPL